MPVVDELIAAVWTVLETNGVRLSAHDDPEYSRLKGQLNTEGLAAVWDELEDLVWKYAYAKGIVDGLWVAITVGLEK